MLHRHRSLSELSGEQRERLDDLRDKFHLFLRKGAGHLTDDPQVARKAVEQSAELFFARLGWSWQLTRLAEGVSRLIWRIHTPRSWLLRVLRQTVRELEGQQTMKTRPAATPSPDVGLTYSPLLARLAKEDCQIKCYRRPPKLIQEGHCRQVCDTLSLLGLELSCQEIGYVLFLPKSTAFDRLTDCEAKFKAMEQATTRKSEKR